MKYRIQAGEKINGERWTAYDAWNYATAKTRDDLVAFFAANGYTLQGNGTMLKTWRTKSTRYATRITFLEEILEPDYLPEPDEEAAREAAEDAKAWRANEHELEGAQFYA